jgi:hypothetical protein
MRNISAEVAFDKLLDPLAGWWHGTSGGPVRDEDFLAMGGERWPSFVEQSQSKLVVCLHYPPPKAGRTPAQSGV